MILLLSFSAVTRADEGMWLLSMLQKDRLEKMQKMGIQLSAEDIYSINNSSLKDAVGALDGGSCTAELISAEGLLLTNHHCGYDEIQNHSSLENNYLKNGFWAMTKEEELPNEGKTVTFVVRIEDVTDQVLPYLSMEISGEARADSVEALTSELVREATEGTHYDAYVKGFFNGNQYFLFVNETFRDVRLVGAPPESIGKFGHDTDNWMWPRHTGDFALFRVYTGPDGLPVDYSPDNIPLEPRHFLPISLKGYELGDFAMVMGFPGSTDRYMTSWEVEELLEITHPNRIKVRGIKQDIMRENMRESEEIDIMYSAKYSKSSNYWKYSIGQSQGLKNLNVVERKQDLEEEFREWMEKDPSRIEKYDGILEDIQQSVAERKNIVHSSQYLFEAMYLGMETIQAGNFLRFLYNELSSEAIDPERLERILAFVKSNATEFYNEYDVNTDMEIMRAMLELMIEDVPEVFQPEQIKAIKDKYEGKLDNYIEKYRRKSILTDREKYMAFLEDPDLKTLEKDPGFQLTLSFIDSYIAMNSLSESINILMERAVRLWIDGLMNMQENRSFYPDANSTIRFTYGTVGDYEPRDAVHYAHFTTMEGIMEKEDPNNPEFIVSNKLKDLFRAKEFGRYGMNGTMPVCFTTNNDITGGNSGSPVINGEGHLIGIAFDGNWEAMSGDVAFETELQKCINVDIRYVLFVIDKYAEATHLIEEMKIIE